MEEFQCGPAQFQKLIDAINKHADPVENSDLNLESEIPGVPCDDNATITSTQSIRLSEEEGVIDGLREQIDTLENEKLEMFEVMKAQIEHDKAYIKQLETGVETQRSMLEAKEVEMSNTATELEQQRSLIKSNEAKVKSLEEKNRSPTSGNATSPR